MKIIVYVEGPSDRTSMEKLLSPLIQEASVKGVAIKFSSLEGKKKLVNKGPKKALNIIRNNPDDCVFLVPDLYPVNVSVPHASREELQSALKQSFDQLVTEKGLQDIQPGERYFVHCFKYDMESLLLASKDALKARVGKERFSAAWSMPVEDQDENDPPKKVVERIFSGAGMKYKDTVDAPWIMERSDLNAVLDQCPQAFAPFVEDIRRLIEGATMSGSSA